MIVVVVARRRHASRIEEKCRNVMVSKVPSWASFEISWLDDYNGGGTVLRCKYSYEWFPMCRLLHQALLVLPQKLHATCNRSPKRERESPHLLFLLQADEQKQKHRDDVFPCWPSGKGKI